MVEKEERKLELPRKEKFLSTEVLEKPEERKRCFYGKDIKTYYSKKQVFRT